MRQSEFHGDVLSETERYIVYRGYVGNAQYDTYIPRADFTSKIRAPGKVRVYVNRTQEHTKDKIIEEQKQEIARLRTGIEKAAQILRGS